MLFGLAWLLNLAYIREEVGEVRLAIKALESWKEGLKDYAASPTNWADCALMSIVLLLPPLMLLNTELACTLTAIGTSLVLIKGRKAVRGNEQMSFLVMMLEAIIADMASFLLLQAASIFSFAFTFALILKAEDPYNDAVLAVFTSYALLMHGDGFGETGLYTYNWLAINFFYTYTLLLNIVMLNALVC